MLIPPEVPMHGPLRGHSPVRLPISVVQNESFTALLDTCCKAAAACNEFAKRLHCVVEEAQAACHGIPHDRPSPAALVPGHVSHYGVGTEVSVTPNESVAASATPAGSATDAAGSFCNSWHHGQPDPHRARRQPLSRRPRGGRTLLRQSALHNPHGRCSGRRHRRAHLRSWCRPPSANCRSRKLHKASHRRCKGRRPWM